jgi:uncharacterized protein YabN with tetrapyrrole methylase and pyrophosphatase domain
VKWSAWLQLSTHSLRAKASQRLSDLNWSLPMNLAEARSEQESGPEWSGRSLCVVGTGIQWAGQTTLAARAAIQAADSVLFAVANGCTAHWLRQLNPRAESLAYPRDGRPRRAIYAAMVERILSELQRSEKVCAVFYGSPAVLAFPAHEAVRRARREGHRAVLVPGVSFLECLFADLDLDPGEGGCQIFEARSFLENGYCFDTRANLVLCQIALAANRGPFSSASPNVSHGLDRLCQRLLEHYPLAHELVLYQAAAHPLESPNIQPIRLDRLSSAPVSEVSTLWVPPLQRKPDRRALAVASAGPGAKTQPRE